MKRIVHARLDSDSERILSNLSDITGWGDSEIIRQGIRILATVTLKKGSTPIIGLGKVKSGLSDLGSNKTHLKGFGKS